MQGQYIKGLDFCGMDLNNNEKEIYNTDRGSNTPKYDDKKIKLELRMAVTLRTYGGVGLAKFFSKKVEANYADGRVLDYPFYN